NGSQLAEEILRAISAEYGWPSYKSVERAATKVEPAQLRRFVGKYGVFGGGCEVKLVDDHLLFESPENGIIEADMFPESDSSFVVTTIPNLTISFEGGDDQEATDIVIKISGQTLKGKRRKQ